MDYGPLVPVKTAKNNHTELACTECFHVLNVSDEIGMTFTSDRYTLSGPSDSSLSLPLCPVHLRGLEFFCRTDNTCICSVCVEAADHRGHNVIPAKREWHIKKVFVCQFSMAVQLGTNMVRPW